MLTERFVDALAGWLQTKQVFHPFPTIDERRAHVTIAHLPATLDLQFPRIGNFVVYRHGKPVLVDAGVETCTAKIFSADRYEIWTMQPAYHTLLPRFDGVQQAPGPEYGAQAVNYAADTETYPINRNGPTPCTHSHLAL